MNKEELKRGNELAQKIAAFKLKIEAAESGLNYPDLVSIKIHFNAYSPYDLDMIMKKDVIKLFKQHYEKLLKEAEAEFEKL